MSFAKRRGRPTRSPEVIFVSTLAVVLLFALYSFGKSQSLQDVHFKQARALRVLEGDEIEVRRTPGSVSQLIFRSAGLLTIYPTNETNAPLSARIVLTKKPA